MFALVAPLPPHLTLKVARTLMSAIAKGDSGTRGVISETAKQVVDGLLGKNE
jgi:pyruvate dehydrogenase (quinone)